MHANEIIPRYTYKDYALWEGYWELIDGHPHAMSPSPKFKHQFIGINLLSLFGDSLKINQSRDCKVIYNLDWIINDSTIVRPDVMIICGPTPDDFLRFPPTLIVEILSETARFKDRSIKFGLYENQGVKYYLLVDPEKESIEVFELMDNQYRSNDPLTIFNLGKCQMSVSFDSLFKY